MTLLAMSIEGCSVFCGKTKETIKTEGLYQDYDNGGLRMTDIVTMIKALRLAWIPRLLKNGQSNWKFALEHFLKSYGGLQFLLTCSYRVKDLENIYAPILQGRPPVLL